MKVHTIALGVLSTLAAAVVQAAPVCSTAELFAGNPLYEEPKDRASDGQGLLDNPPLAWRWLLFVDDKLVTHVGQEIWYTDLKAAKPVIKRLAGRENQSGQSSKPGACQDARFANIAGLALKSDGSIVGADQTGNNIFLVKDPFGANCKVTFLAGSMKAIERVIPGRPPNVGDIDGPGSSARFQLVNWPAVIDDNIYFIDDGSRKIKHIANDTANTVKTIAKLPKDIGHYYAMIALNGKLYVVGGRIFEIEPATGAIRDIVRVNDVAFGGSSDISGLATDGKGLFTASSGRVLYVTLDGKVNHIAGNGNKYGTFSQPYDPTRPQTAQSVQLVATLSRRSWAGSKVFLAHKDNAVYYNADARTVYIERLTCE